MNDPVSFDDIWDLWRAGAIHLPNMGNQYGKAAQEVHKAAMSASNAFDGAVPELATAFAELRNALQDKILVKGGENLYKSGEALSKLAVRFSEQDGDNATRLQDSIKGLEDATPENRPPDVTETAPSSDDPHPEEQPERHGGV